MDHPKDHCLFGLGLPGYIHVEIQLHFVKSLRFSLTIPRLNSGCAKIVGIHFSYPRNLGDASLLGYKQLRKRWSLGDSQGVHMFKKMQSIVWIFFIYSLIYLLIHISPMVVI